MSFSMKSLRIKHLQALAVAACLGFVSSSAANGENIGSEEDLIWSPSAFLGLRFSGGSFLGGSSNDQMFSDASAAIAQTNRWLREIDMRGIENETFSGAPGETVVMHLQN